VINILIQSGHIIQLIEVIAKLEIMLMPPNDFLRDRKLAEVLTYIRSNFGK
jgi:hypothetical protein